MKTSRAIPILLAACVAATTAPAVTPETGGIVDDVGRIEYRFSADADGATAPNRAHGLRVRVGPRGGSFVPREPDRFDGCELELRLVGMRRGSVDVPVGAGYVAIDGDRAEVVRSGATDWFVNGVDGIEHGVDLPYDPHAGDGDLVLRYDVGDRVRIESRGAGLVVADPRGRPWLTYTSLVVVDATGAPVPSRMTAVSGGFEFVVDDRDAVYPVTIDPLLQSATWKQYGDQTSAFVGAQVSTAGDVDGDGYSDVLVAAYGFDNGQSNEGRVWVQYGGPGGPGGTPTILESNQAGAQFGFSIGAAGDIDGDGYDDFVVGANRYDAAGLTDAGAVYVYLGGPSGPTLDRILVGDQAGGQLGRSANGAGDVDGDGHADVVAGAYAYDDAFTDEGRAYVYLGGPGGIAATPAWTADGGQAGAFFGVSVAHAGDTDGDGYADVIVGAFLYDNGQTDEGLARVYLGGSGGLASTPAWTQDGDWTGGRFGFSVGPAGDVDGDGYADVVVGAYLTDFSLSDEGAAYVYLGGPGGPSLSRHVSWYGGQAGANLGRSVFTAGDVNGDGFADVAVGAPNHDGRGRVRVYHGSPGGLSTTPAWFVDGDSVADEFGKGVGTAGDVDGDGYSDLMIGDPTADNGETNEGAVWVYRGSGDGLDTNRTTRTGPAGGARLGRVVAYAGDVDGDGHGDVITRTDATTPAAIEVQAWYGGVAGIPGTASWTATPPPNASSEFGAALSGAGDVDGDGFDDVLVGDPLYTGDVYREGRVALYLGGAGGLAASAHRLFVGNDSQVRFGDAVAGAGDVNGDGYGDIVVGAPDWQVSDGAVFVYHGGPGGPDSTAPTTTLLGSGGDRLGNAVAGAGDVDGDGYSDIIVCRGETRNAYVYRGSASGLDPAAPWTLTPDSGGAACTHVAGVGDVDRDGYADVAYGDTVAERVYVFLGSPTGPSATPDRTYTSTQSGGSEIGPVAGAGDVDGDGYADLVLGESTLNASGGSASGRARLYLGSSSGPATSPAWTDDGDQADAGYGTAVAGVGDVNGDGFADLVVGEPGYDVGSLTSAGRFHFHFGGGGDGLDRVPRQQRPAGTSEPPIALLGRSPDETRIRLRSRARSAAGRTRIRVEYEVRPWSESYTGVPTHASNTLRSSAPGSDGSRINFSSPISGLVAGERYRWRLRFRSDDPRFPGTPWMSQAGRAGSEWAVRTDCQEDVWYRDADGDGFGDPNDTITTCDDNPAGYVPVAGDCADDDADVWRVPGETAALALADDGIETTLTWSAPADPGGAAGSWVYDVVRSDTPDGFAPPGSATCVVSDLIGEMAVDPDVPPSGVAYRYLVRANNLCGDGSLGDDSGGTERQAPVCP